MGSWQVAIRKDQLVENEGRSIRIAGHRIAVFLVEGTIYAIEDSCPHAGAALSRGYIENGTVSCPLHYWRFRLSDGAWADNPTLSIGCYATRIVDDLVQVEIPDDPPLTEPRQ
ncbi:nitrite reductase small subunit NirD [Tuwongella immobilis]|uniref:Rieske domain-containing protein n=1 Tax=Tuwongella immobilis TaxID=692036 RepID=A0A6C2YM01_9BACT|nr:nitrite reductase small subunit NirD [Tuwongella immobilis]VIP02456.1 assimilatory nitrite reductase : Nitrite reductase [NAD(P)H] small subunit OS=uncultured bacterium A1Q1_fos_962 PE=4 SV=1: Rieske_2 [Tuwongella immobilis]VTS01453.1 assimilatory nitrite reductase : Nitrite reductase [NAD(P)H] small subunit OS=uncultured bacterium A1Q1_fos_962 PE=4 SV=1: Rieske_2 [Tuwongella immobilis]